jgi:hypothetical protein
MTSTTRLKLALGMALLSSSAHAITPTALPQGVTAEVVDEQICYGVSRELQQHIRNIYATRRAFNTTWYMNSKGEYLAFDCYYLESIYRPYPYNTKAFSVVYRTSRDVIEGEVKRERDAIQNAIKERQQLVKDSNLL